MNGRFYVNNQGYHLFSGEYFESEILNRKWWGTGDPQLYQNHCCTEEEIDGMVRFFALIRRMGLIGTTGSGAAEIQAAQERLQTELPAEIIAFYTALDGAYDYVCNRKNQTLMKPDELFIRDGVLAFAYTGKRKKRHLGIGLTERHLFVEPEPGEAWEYELCLESFCELMIEMAAITAISRLPERVYFRLRGEEQRSLNACEEMEKFLEPLWKRYDGYFNCYNAVMVNEETQSLAWMRGTDIRIGAQKPEVITAFKELRGEEGYYGEKPF